MARAIMALRILRPIADELSVSRSSSTDCVAARSIKEWGSAGENTQRDGCVGEEDNGKVDGMARSEATGSPDRPQSHARGIRQTNTEWRVCATATAAAADFAHVALDSVSWRFPLANGAP
ncbi:hypothetical protein GCM10027419_47400 [Pandoraea terrae]